MKEKLRINYISNSSLDDISGGWSGLNYRLYEILSKEYHVNYIGPLNFRYFMGQSLLSKMLRAFRYRSKYFFYSEKKLEKIKKSVEKLIKNDNINVFFGSTPYIKYKSKAPYFVVTDICFLGYYKYYNEDNFLISDLDRIKDLERQFFKGATKVFFTSNWALEETMELYNLTGENFYKIGVGGNIEGFATPVEDNITTFLFISNDFKRKGGNEAFSSFLKIFRTDNNVELKIIGDKPPKRIMRYPGVSYEGRFDKLKAVELKNFKELISKSSLLVMPTKSDASPLTIIECGYFGVPTVAPEDFAIGEIIRSEISGFLVQRQFEETDFYNVMLKVHQMTREQRNKIRKSTFQYYIDNYDWNRVGHKLITEINKSTR